MADNVEAEFHPFGIFVDLHRRDFRKEPIEEWTRLLQGLQGLGLNTVVAKVNEAMLERADLLGFKVITGAQWDRPERTAAWERHESLLAWIGTDEPGRTEQIELAKEQYAAFRQTARRPLAVSLYLPSAYVHANELADILVPDPYIFGYEKPDGTSYPILEIADRIAALHKELREGRRIWAAPQLFAWHPYFKRPPTPEEVEAETILCLGEGAEGVIYFALNSGDYFPNPPEYEPKEIDAASRPWELYEHPELLDTLRKMSKIARHIQQQFGGRAEKTLLENGIVRYTWTKGSDRFEVEIRTQPTVEVLYGF